MTFEIRRAKYTGFGGIDKKPCKGAFKENDKWYIEIDSLEELIELLEREDPSHGLIIGYNNHNDMINDKDIDIMIYDDYLE
jgi:hypothetical protein